MTNAEIEQQLGSIEEELLLLSDEKSLEAELIEHNKPTFKQLSEVQIEEDEIIKELEELKNLWVVANFIKEIEVNLELYEIESVALSLEKLAAKIDLLSNKEVQHTAQEKLNALNDFFDMALETVWSRLLVASTGSLELHGQVEVDGALVEYETFVGLVSQRKSMNINVPMLIDEQLITKLVSNKYTFGLDDNVVRYAPSKQNDIQTMVTSVVSIVNFISQFPESIKIVHYITTRLYDWMKTVVVDNIEQIHNRRELQDDLLNLNEFLISHGFKRDDLKNWVKFELNDLTNNYYLSSHIDELREFFKVSDPTSVFDNLVIRSKQDQQLSTIPQQSKKTISKPEADADIDAWDEWPDDDMEFPDDEEEQEDVSETKRDDQQDDWDAWDEDDDAPVPGKRLVSKLSKKSTSPTPTGTTVLTKPSTPSQDEFKTSSIPDRITPIFESFISKEQSEPSQSKLKELFYGYYMLSLDFYTNKFLLYNDLRFLAQKFHITQHEQTIESLLTEAAQEQETPIFETFNKLEGLNPGLTSSFTFGIIRDIDSRYLALQKQLDCLTLDLHSEIITASITNLYESIIRVILRMFEIEDDMGEYLTIVISKFLELSVIGQPGVEKNKIKNFAKLQQIQFMIKNDMKTVMESFYNAELYDLSTEEIITLIKGLFVDSGERRANIIEIKEIRESIL